MRHGGQAHAHSSADMWASIGKKYYTVLYTYNIILLAYTVQYIVQCTCRVFVLVAMRITVLVNSRPVFLSRTNRPLNPLTPK